MDQIDFDDDSYDVAKFAVLHEEEEEEDDNEDENDLGAEGDAQHQDRQSDVPPLADENSAQHAVDPAAAAHVSLSPSDRLLIEEACRTPPSAASTGHSPDRIPTTRHPRRPRALSYDSGLAEWTVRLQRYSQGDDEYDPDGADNDNDASGTALGESASSASGGAGFGLGLGLGSAPPFSTSGGRGGLASGGTAAVGGASPSTAGEDRSRAQTAMERIRNKRAGAMAAAAANDAAAVADRAAAVMLFLTTGHTPRDDFGKREREREGRYT